MSKTIWFARHWYCKKKNQFLKPSNHHWNGCTLTSKSMLHCCLMTTIKIKCLNSDLTYLVIIVSWILQTCEITENQPCICITQNYHIIFTGWEKFSFSRKRTDTTIIETRADEEVAMVFSSSNLILCPPFSTETQVKKIPHSHKIQQQQLPVKKWNAKKEKKRESIEEREGRGIMRQGRKIYFLFV